MAEKSKRVRDSLLAAVRHVDLLHSDVGGRRFLGVGSWKLKLLGIWDL